MRCETAFEIKTNEDDERSKNKQYNMPANLNGDTIFSWSLIPDTNDKIGYLYCMWLKKKKPESFLNIALKLLKI